MKKILSLVLVCLLILGLAGCSDRLNGISVNTPPEEIETPEEDEMIDKDETNEEIETPEEGETGVDGTFAVNDKIELYSCTFRAANDTVQPAVRALSSSATISTGDLFFIDITLIDLEDSIDFIYTVIINGEKYRNSDGALSNTFRDKAQKIVTFSVLLEYDGVTDTYAINDIIIMSDLAIRYYVTISEEYKPVVIPTQKGDGTQENPYLIYNAEMMLEMQDYPAGTYFKQANDIDLSTVDTGEKSQGVLDCWKPIGTFANPFVCNYDGDHYKITRLSIQRLDGKYSEEGFGLFGTAQGCEIKNVILEDYRVEVRYARTVGALVGFAQECEISDCKLVQGRKENFESGSWSFSNMGGLIGFANETNVKNCDVKSDLGLYREHETDYPAVGMLGGVVGEFRGGVMSNCTFSGSIESGVVAGGIVGRCDLAEIADCKSNADITSSFIAGGIIGQMWRSELSGSSFEGNISFPFNNGMTLPDHAYFGGIVGDAGIDYVMYADIVNDGYTCNSAITDCKFFGEIKTASRVGDLDVAYAGGVCARLFDCIISDIELDSAEVRGKYAYAVTALSFGTDYYLSDIVIRNVVLIGSESQGIASVDDRYTSNIQVITE